MAESKESKNSLAGKLRNELIELVPQIDEEGLVFLLQQANTIIHNQRVVELNRDLEKISSKKNAVNSSSSSKKNTGENIGFEIEIDRSKNGKTYYFTVNGRKHFMDVAETKKIVELCYRPPTKSKALKFLYQYFLNERDEVLSEHKIKSEKSPFFEALFNSVRENFSL